MLCYIQREAESLSIFTNKHNMEYSAMVNKTFNEENIKNMSVKCPTSPLLKHIVI